MSTEAAQPPIAQLPPPSFALAPPVEVPAPPVRVAELAGLAGLVTLADLTLYSGSGGYGDAVLLAGGTAIVFAATPVRRLSARLWGMTALVAALAARSYWAGSAFTLLLGLAGVFSIAVALRTRRSYVPEVVVSGFASAFGAFGALWQCVTGSFRLVTRGRVRGVRWGTVLVPIAVVLVFGLVFVAANPLLERWVGLFWDALFGGQGTFFTPGRVAFWLGMALVAAGLLAPRVRELRLTEHLGPGHRIEGEIAGPTSNAVITSRNVLLGVNVLFLAYNALDAVYLWAGTPPPGLSHDVYAHRGTVWLTVTLLLATIVLGLVFRGGMNARTPETRMVRALGLAWAVQNFVLAAGTFRRIEMYIADSGLTVLRCLGIVGVVVVVAGFALIVKKIVSRHTALWLLRSQFDVFFLALVLWTVAPVDALVWSFNADRISRGDQLPLLHLVMQDVSAEGVASFSELIEHDDPVVAHGVAARLVAMRRELRRERGESSHWAGHERARDRALAHIATLAPRLEQMIPDGAAEVSAEAALRSKAYAANGLNEYGNPTWESDTRM
jgi:hypothetical protein